MPIITEIPDEEINEYLEKTKDWKWVMPIIEKPKRADTLLPKRQRGGKRKYIRRIGVKSSMDYKNQTIKQTNE